MSGLYNFLAKQKPSKLTGRHSVRQVFEIIHLPQLDSCCTQDVQSFMFGNLLDSYQMFEE
jgi:hypothetical protein